MGTNRKMLYMTLLVWFVGSEGTLASPRNYLGVNSQKTSESICVLLADFTSIEAAGQLFPTSSVPGIIPAGMR